MPARRKPVNDVPPAEPAEFEPESSPSEPEIDQPAPAKPRRGDIHAAREKALQKIRERTEQKEKARQLAQAKAELEKELLEAETLATQRQLQEVRKLKQKAMEAPKSRRKKAPTPSESEEEESEEEERPPPRRKVTPKPAAPPAPSHEDVLRAAYEQRIQALRQSLYQQAFS